MPSPFFFSAHATPHSVAFHFDDGQSRRADARQAAHMITRLARGESAGTPLVLLACQTGALPSGSDGIDKVAVAQHVANRSRRMVWAPTTDAGIFSADGAGRAYIGVKTDAAGQPGRLVLFRPEPTSDRLDAHARVLMHVGPEAQVPSAMRGRVLRLVRTVLGADFENAQEYRSVLRDLYQIDTLREDVPAYKDGLMSVELLRRLSIPVLQMDPSRMLLPQDFLRLLQRVHDATAEGTASSLLQIFPELLPPAPAPPASASTSR